MFITFEGIEGSGKTTQIKYIAEFLKSNGYSCVITREPGGTTIGKKIRAILLDPENGQLAPLSELLLYAADRAQHIHSKIKPFLSEGKTVICDRFSDSTTVYQGYARGLSLETIRALNRMVLEDITPDITFLLDLDPSKGLKRAWKQIASGARENSETRFEKEAISFHERIRSGYLELARLEPSRFRIIDAAKDELDVKNDILNALLAHLSLAPDDRQIKK